MTLDGWIVMLISVGGVATLFGFCVYKVLTTPEAIERVQAPVEVDPGDREP